MTKNIIKEISLSAENIKDRIYIIRGRKVMLDKDLAVLYGVPTKRLNEAVKRNIERFPEDFMFELSLSEAKLFLRSQIATLKKGRGTHMKYSPVAFTEQGIAMLSSVRRSPRAIQVNIQIIRIFTKMRELIDSYKELREKVEDMEKTNEATFKEIFRVIRMLIREESKPKGKLGFETK